MEYEEENYAKGAYERMSDFERLRFVEKYNRQLQIALSEKTEKLMLFNERYSNLRNDLKQQFPGWSRLVTYKEELRIARKKVKESKQRVQKAELNVIELQMDIAVLKSENRELRLMVETPTN